MTIPRTDDLLLPAAFALFAGTALMASVGLGQVAKLLYPLAAFGLSALVVVRRPAFLVSFLLWLLFVTPMLRRMVELHSGYSQINPMMLAPYLAAVTALPAVAAYLLAGRSHAKPFTVLLAALAFGLAVVLLDNRLLSGGVEAMRWTLPPLLAIYVVAHSTEAEQIRAAVLKTFLFGIAFLGLYGLYQFVFIPAWDAAFMLAAPIQTIGKPLPFEVRVFGSMNSPGSLAMTLSTGLLLLLPSARRWWQWLIIGLGLAVLALTMQRATQAAFIIAVAALLLFSHTRIFLRLAYLSVLSICVVGIAATVPQVRELLAKRLETTINLSDDVSAKVRLRQYENAPTWLEKAPFGQGFGWASPRSRLDGSERIYLDSGIIQIFTSLGIPVAVIFTLMFIVIIGQGIHNGIINDDPQAKVEIAIVVLGVSQLPFGASHVGEDGFLLWLAIGLLLSRPTHRPPAMLRQCATDV